MKKKWLSAIGIVLTGICIPLDYSIVYTSLPAIQKGLNASLLELQWIMNIYGLAIAIPLVTMGRLGDILGRKKLYLAGVIAFAFATFFAGLSISIEWLIFFRFWQGLAGAAILSLGQALIALSFSEKDKGKAIGFWATMIGLGFAVGPVLGGMISSFLGWRWIFFLNLPLIALGLIFMSFTVKESKNEESLPTLDKKGLCFLSLGISALMIAIIQGPEWGFGSWISLSLFALSLFSLLFLFLSEEKTKVPIIEFHLFLNRRFFLSSLANSSLIFFLWGVLFLMPLYLHNERLISMEKVGLLMLITTLPLALFSHAIGRWVDRFGSKICILLGLFCFLFSSLLQAYFQPHTPFWIVICALLSWGFGLALAWGPSTTSGLSSLPIKIAGVASGTWLTLQEIFGTLGLAVAGTIVRAYPSFSEGYHRASWVNFILLLITFSLCACFLKKEKSKN